MRKAAGTACTGIDLDTYPDAERHAGRKWFPLLCVCVFLRHAVETSCVRHWTRLYPFRVHSINNYSSPIEDSAKPTKFGASEQATEVLEASKTKSIVFYDHLNLKKVSNFSR